MQNILFFLNPIHETVKPKLKGRQHYDEKYVKVNGEDWFDLNCIDHITKYISAHLLVKERTKKKCKEFLSQIKKTCYEQILEVYRKEKNKQKEKRKLITFVSDMFGNYKSAWNSLFFRVTKLKFGVPIACRKYGLEHNNNAIERYNGDLKSRLKIMRGGFRSKEGAKAFLNMKRVIHNFVNPHQELCGRTPAEAAEIKLPLGRNRLLSLIKYWAKRRITKR